MDMDMDMDMDISTALPLELLDLCASYLDVTDFAVYDDRTRDHKTTIASPTERYDRVFVGPTGRYLLAENDTVAFLIDLQNPDQHRRLTECYSFAWSPGGTYLALLARNEGKEDPVLGATYDLCVYECLSGEVHFVENVGNHALAWRSEHVLLWASESAISTLDVATGAIETRHTKDDTEGVPSLSPDGAYYTKSVRTDLHIYETKSLERHTVINTKTGVDVHTFVWNHSSTRAAVMTTDNCIILYDVATNSQANGDWRKTRKSVWGTRIPTSSGETISNSASSGEIRSFSGSLIRK